MLYNLTKLGKDWVVEVSGDPSKEPMVKTFGSREAADKWRRDVAHGKEPQPVLSAKGKPKPKPPTKPKAKKAKAVEK